MTLGEFTETNGKLEGKKVQITPDDYVLAALNLYLDILNLFLYILSILGDSK